MAGLKLTKKTDQQSHKNQFSIDLCMYLSGNLKVKNSIKVIGYFGCSAGCRLEDYLPH